MSAFCAMAEDFRSVFVWVCILTILQTYHILSFMQQRRWFVEMAYRNPLIYHSDGHRDGKVDAFFQTTVGNKVNHYIVNAKFTKEFDKQAPVTFYDEIIAFNHLFAEATKRQREDHLQTVKASLRDHYSNLFDLYDEGSAELIFITNCRANPKQFQRVKGLAVTVYHLEDLLQFLLDDLEIAMPKTPPLSLQSVFGLLKAREDESEVATTIIFARLIDFIQYLKRQDPFHLLFARNVRLFLGNTPVNTAIAITFEKHPREFVYSNNGITLLCDDYSDKPNELIIYNPRVVNGSQTLHSVSQVSNPSADARVMVRLVKLPPLTPNDPEEWVRKRKDIINRISVRSNQQNPVKKWDLVANDDFQLEIFRFFRERKIYYERRQKEWSERSRELSGSAIRHGPNVKYMAQLIASYKYGDKELGPARAKSNPAELFDDDSYRRIAETNPELAFQLYLLNTLILAAYKSLSQAKYRMMRGHIDFILLSLVSKILKDIGAEWGEQDLTAFLQREMEASNGLNLDWRRLVKAISEIIYVAYQAERQTYKREKEKDLSPNNFFKAAGYVNEILKRPFPNEAKKYAKQLIADI